MGAIISSTVSLGLTYCCCNSVGSLCNACLGSTAEGTTGRKRSVLLLTLAVVLALWFQYTVGPAIVAEHGMWWTVLQLIPGLSKRIHHTWLDSCADYEGDAALLSQCAGQAGVYRVMLVSFVFFCASAAAAKVQPSLNREAWPAKYGTFLAAVALTIFFDNSPIFTGFFLVLSRIGAAIFLILQQIILIDVAYNWNENWVDRADEQDRLSFGSGSSWLHAIVGTCISFYVLSLAGIVVLYTHFDGCASNVWVITLTLLGVIALTAVQLSGSEGSLLTSSILSLYAVYLAYSMVSKNPNGECNPQLGQDDSWGIAAGLFLTAVSLAWTGLSWTAEERLGVKGVQTTQSVTHAPEPQAVRPEGTLDLNVPFMSADSQAPSGLVMDPESGVTYTSMSGSHLWKLNVVMVLISCYISNVLTGWGTMNALDDEKNAANPTAGRVNMAMIGISQWFAIGLYIWTLVAPRLFPDRDFS